MGAFLGALMLFGFLDLIPGAEWFAESRWRAGGVAALIGGSLGAVTGLFVYWRVQAIKALAEDLGMKFIEKAEHDLGHRLKKLFAAHGNASFRNVMYREMGGVKLWVGDYILVKSGGKNQSRIVRTVALFEKDGFALPQFSLQREGMLLNMMSGIMGIEDIDFDDSPVFSKTYHLSGKPADAVRQLFPKRVRDYFTEEKNWEVRGEASQLVVLRPRRKMSASMLRSFIVQATEIIALFDESAAGRKKLPPVRREEEPTGTPAYLRNLLVDDEEVAQFLKQPAPRNVPAPIARQYLGGNASFMLIAGIFLIVFGTFWAFALSVIPDAPKFVLVPIGVLVAGFGLILLVSGIRSRKARLGLLTNGRVTTGTVDEVETRNVRVNNQQGYLAKVTFYDGKQQTQATTAVYGLTGERLCEMTGESVSVLYDPQNPSYFVLATQLATNVNFRI
jgi:hypothetical protein